MVSYEVLNEIIDLLSQNQFFLKSDNLELIMSRGGLDDLIKNISLNGAPITVLFNVVRYLNDYGMVSFDHYALGRFLNAAMANVGIDQQKVIQKLVSDNKLMLPSSIPPSVPQDKRPITEEFELLKEAVIGENTLRGISFIALALETSRCICLVVVPSGCGTGFLITPDLVITSNHVIWEPQQLEKSTFRFNYQLDTHGKPEEFKEFKFASGGIFYPNKELDYTIIQLADSPGLEWGIVKFSSIVPDIKKRVNIIQHPQAGPKQISIQNNFIEYSDNEIIQYLTATEPGSSGSPVFDDNWAVIGMHRGTRPIKKSDGEETHYRNEGFRFSRIYQSLPENIKASIK